MIHDRSWRAHGPGHVSSSEFSGAYHYNNARFLVLLNYCSTAMTTDDQRLTFGISAGIILYSLRFEGHHLPSSGTHGTEESIGATH